MAGKTVGTPTKKKAQPYMAKTEKGTVGVAKPKPIKAASAPKPKASRITRGALTIKERMPKSSKTARASQFGTSKTPASGKKYRKVT